MERTTPLNRPPAASLEPPRESLTAVGARLPQGIAAELRQRAPVREGGSTTCQTGGTRARAASLLSGTIERGAREQETKLEAKARTSIMRRRSPPPDAESGLAQGPRIVGRGWSEAAAKPLQQRPREGTDGAGTHDTSLGRERSRSCLGANSSDMLRPPETCEFLGLASALAATAAASCSAQSVDSRMAFAERCSPHGDARSAQSNPSGAMTPLPTAGAFTIAVPGVDSRPNVVGVGAAGGCCTQALERSPAASPAHGRRVARTSTEDSLNKITDSLRAARRQARMRRLLVQAPVLVAGSMLVAAGCCWYSASHFVPLAGGQAAELSSAFVLCGVALTVVSVLPGDRALVAACLFAAGSVAPSLLAAGRLASVAVRVSELARLAPAVVGPAAPSEPVCADPLRLAVPCWLVAAHAAADLFAALHFLLCAARCLRAVALRLPPRAQLDIMWPAFGLALWATFIVDLFLLLCTAGAGLFAAPVAYGHDVATPFFLALELGLSLLFTVQRVRGGVHAWLASRGEAVTTAAAIAALIGSRRPEEVQALAAATFKAVSLSDVTLSELSSNAPGSADLHLLAKPVRIGEVDSFVSHRSAARPHARCCAPLPAPSFLRPHRSHPPSHPCPHPVQNPPLPPPPKPPHFLAAGRTIRSASGPSCRTGAPSSRRCTTASPSASSTSKAERPPLLPLPALHLCCCCGCDCCSCG